MVKTYCPKCRREVLNDIPHVMDGTEFECGHCGTHYHVTVTVTEPGMWRKVWLLKGKANFGPRKVDGSLETTWIVAPFLDREFALRCAREANDRECVLDKEYERRAMWPRYPVITYYVDGLDIVDRPAGYVELEDYGR